MGPPGRQAAWFQHLCSAWDPAVIRPGWAGLPWPQKPLHRVSSGEGPEYICGESTWGIEEPRARESLSAPSLSVLVCEMGGARKMCRVCSASVFPRPPPRPGPQWGLRHGCRDTPVVATLTVRKDRWRRKDLQKTPAETDANSSPLARLAKPAVGGGAGGKARWHS